MKRPDARRPRVEKVQRSVLVGFRCTPAERLDIEARAAAAGLALSEYVRVSVLNTTIKAKADRDAIDQLAGHAANLSRLGGLLKQWLAERRGDGAPAVRVDAVLGDIRAAVARLADAATRI